MQITKDNLTIIIVTIKSHNVIDECLKSIDPKIKKIIVGGNKRMGLMVIFKTKGMTGLSNYTIQFENALSTDEVKGFGLSSDDALTALKKAKDKLDLGLITQEEYDKLKLELSNYIK